jgi:hypothetical protein
MFRRLLMMWLIISTVGYGSVWAIAGHLDEAAEHQAVAADAGHTPDDEGNHCACDHCCHASAHILALWPTQPGAVCPVADTGYTPYLQSLSRSTTSPPERPPQG